MCLQPFSSFLKVCWTRPFFGLWLSWVQGSLQVLPALLWMKESGKVEEFLFFLSMFTGLPDRVALQVVQQMQQQQNMQMNMMMNLVQQVQTGHAAPPPGPPATPPPSPPEEAPPSGGGAEAYHGSEQGVRMCSRCCKVAYLREGVCFNLDCVSWLHYDFCLLLRRLYECILK